MKAFRVEYFITLDQDEILCRDRSSFELFLNAASGFSMKENHIEYQSIEIEYKIDAGKISVDKQRYFHIILEISEEEDINEFEDFLKTLRTILDKVSKEKIQVLWNDLGLYYAYQAYPLVHEIENIMRKLITKFMLINVGSSWHKDSVPREVSDSIKTKEAKNRENANYHSYLYEADFIQLSNFLFKAYTSSDTKAFNQKIRNANVIEDLDLSELKNYLPRSNWERYFAKLVDCESDFLRTRWEKVHEKRNQIAHNKPMNKTEFTELQKLVSEIKPKLQEAVSKLDKVTLRKDQRESIVENVVENLTNRPRLNAAAKAALSEVANSYAANNVFTRVMLASLTGFIEENNK